MRMKWSNENFMRQCEIADKKLEYEQKLNLQDEYALNLRDCRDMYSRLENYGKTQFCLGCERHARRVAELEAQLAQQKQMYEQEAKWRKAYQEAKGKMYEAGGDIGQFAIDNMPCNEGELDLWFRKIYVSREAHDNLRAELEAQLAEARRDGERLDLIESRYLCVSYLSMNSKWDVLTNEAHPAHRKHYQRKSLRAAIDAAAAAEEGKKG